MVFFCSVLLRVLLKLGRGYVFVLSIFFDVYILSFVGASEWMFVLLVVIVLGLLSSLNVHAEFLSPLTALKHSCVV